MLQEGHPTSALYQILQGSLRAAPQADTCLGLRPSFRRWFRLRLRVPSPRPSPKLTRTPRHLRKGTYGLRVPASRLRYVPEAQRGLPPRPHVLYVLGARNGLGNTVPYVPRVVALQVELQLKDQAQAVVVGHRGAGEMFGETSLLKVTPEP